MGSRDLSVDAVAQRLGVTPRTLHYYEEVGLIPPVPRTAGGHRVYDEGVVQRIDQILRLKETLGYSLQEIKQLLASEDVLTEQRESFLATADPLVQEEIMRTSIDVIDEVVQRIDDKITRLEEMKDKYQTRLERIQRRLDGTD